MSNYVLFTKDESGQVFGYDPDEVSQALAQKRIRDEGHVEYTPPTPTRAQALAAAKTAALAAVSATVMETRYSIAGTRDDAEIAGWPNKARLAQQIDAGEASDAIKAPFLREMRQRVRSETLEQFTEKVMRNDVLFSAAVGDLDGIKTSVVDAINAATTTAAVDAAVASLGAKLAEAFPQQYQA